MMEAVKETEDGEGRAINFVNWIFERMQNGDNHATAKLKRADNPATASYAWDLLCTFNINLDNDKEFLPYSLIGAAICKSNRMEDGGCPFGKALCGLSSKKDKKMGEGKQRPADEARLKRLLGCSRIDELCDILRPLLPMIVSKSNRPLSFKKLLCDLMDFGRGERARERVKKNWAQDYYSAWAADNVTPGKKDSESMEVE